MSTKTFRYGNALRVFRRQCKINQEWQAKRLTGGWPHPDAKKKLVEKVAAALAETMPQREAKVYGPYGLSSSFSIHFPLKSDPDNEKASLSINFTSSCEDGLRVRDYSKSSDEFKPGTIGHLNGMNHPDVAIPRDAGVDWFKAWIK